MNTFPRIDALVAAETEGQGASVGHNQYDFSNPADPLTFARVGPLTQS